MTNDEWSQEVERLTAYFEATEIPVNGIGLGAYSTVLDTKSFISTNLLRARQGAGSNWQRGSLFRLHQLEARLLELAQAA